MSTHRAGFSMVEMLLVLVLGMMLLAGAYGTLVRQEEGYRHFNAVAGTQQDTRMGIELLSTEFREISGGGADLVVATPDSARFRALRKFGILCDKSSSEKKLLVAQIGVDPFATGDSLMIYVDGDTLKASDDRWKAEFVQGVQSASLCGTTLGLQIDVLLPSSNLTTLQLPGTGLKFDSVFPGAPIRSFEVLGYGAGTYDGQTMLLRTKGGVETPLFGPIAATDGLAFRYFDALGNELTGFPLNAAARASVRRVQVMLRAERTAGGVARTYSDSLVTDIHLRGG